MAFESLNFDNYDLVISVTSADAKGIITKPGTFHLCYCLTPTRYLWSHEDFYKSQTSKVFHPLFNYLKSWDLIASRRPDAYLAISKTVQSRIKKYYGQDSQVIYPPVNVEAFSQHVPAPNLKDFFLYVGRLVAYKQAEVLVETFNDLKLPLVIIGTGSLESKLKAMANANVYFLGQVSDTKLATHYRHARAVLYIHEEDFGLVPLEAHAAGTPVIGLNTGGVTETVIHGQTGLLLNSVSELKNAILNFDASKYDREFIKAHAQKFAKARFKEEFLHTINKL
ncbi:MAG: Glycosyl transferase group 1 [Candidatus Amesbacteria bacterium GW2011_GWA1_47_20]|uniref:Glycosyl transferase group 1 n=1 Tax=Candidatus Amesbacteria bacterium GW2011_GWA1_47_20 TaxID=1618354 RepID=A0A0G1USX1_9BACT|nr:MAG: Glycosyl transferase group 1 [Candidatus Amesbacteria bacterium GW2011_GWA1_47_20]